MLGTVDLRGDQVDSSCYLVVITNAGSELLSDVGEAPNAWRNTPQAAKKVTIHKYQKSIIPTPLLATYRNIGQSLPLAHAVHYKYSVGSIRLRC
jgi:hypothetical protein